MNRTRTSHPIGIYGPSRRHAKACAALSLCVAALLGVVVADIAAAQTTHIVRLEVDAERDVHRFVPARISARPGDVLLFRVSSGAPHAIAFEGSNLSATARNLLQAALPNRGSDLEGPVLARNGVEYRVTVPRLPAGTYRFYSTPHRAYEMRGELIVN
jgi:plastocyanin